MRGGGRDMRLPDRHDQEPRIGGQTRDIGDVAEGLREKDQYRDSREQGHNLVARQCHLRRVGRGADKKRRDDAALAWIEFDVWYKAGAKRPPPGSMSFWHSPQARQRLKT